MVIIIIMGAGIDNVTEKAKNAVKSAFGSFSNLFASPNKSQQDEVERKQEKEILHNYNCCTCVCNFMCVGDACKFIKLKKICEIIVFWKFIVLIFNTFVM